MNIGATTVTLVIAAITFIANALYTFATFRMLREMRAQNEAVKRPYITISAMTLPKNPIFYLKISNTGESPATQVRLNMDRSFFQFGDKNQHDISKLSAFTDKIEVFPPGMELAFYLARGWDVFGETSHPDLAPAVFKVDASYSFGSQQYYETTTVDLTPFRETAVNTDATVDTLVNMVDQVRTIAEVMKERQRKEQLEKVQRDWTKYREVGAYQIFE